MKRVLAVLFGLLVLAAFVGTAFYLYAGSAEPEVVHETDAPQVMTIVKKTVATGSVVPRKEVAIKPQVSGIVDQVMVEPGDLVSEGDLIARIRIIPDMVNLANAESRVNRARLNLEDARKDRERNRRLDAQGTISKAALQESEHAYQQAREEIAAARENLQLVQTGSAKKRGETTNTLVRSTSRGMVLEVPIEEGSSVIEANTFNDGTTIATVADMNDLVFEGRVDESEVGKLETGMELLLTIGALEGERFRAELEHVAPKGVSDQGAIKFEIRAALSLESDAFVRANYSANADIVLDRREDVLAINEALLLFDGGTPYVEVETATQVFERRDLQLGLSDGIHVEVLDGLQADARVKKPVG